MDLYQRGCGELLADGFNVAAGDVFDLKTAEIDTTATLRLQETAVISFFVRA